MAKKEFKVGEIFQLGLVKLRVEKQDEDVCTRCVLYHFGNCDVVHEFTGSCFHKDREDNNNVMFVKVEE